VLWRQRRLLHSRLSWFGGELSGGAISDYEPAESKVVTFECYWPETVCSGVASPSGYSVLSTGSLPTASPAPFTAGAARSSGTVVSALAVALFGAVALM
jgi:hypothetical protein